MSAQFYPKHQREFPELPPQNGGDLHKYREKHPNVPPHIPEQRVLPLVFNPIRVAAQKRATGPMRPLQTAPTTGPIVQPVQPEEKPAYPPPWRPRATSLKPVVPSWLTDEPPNGADLFVERLSVPLREFEENRSEVTEEEEPTDGLDIFVARMCVTGQMAKADLFNDLTEKECEPALDDDPDKTVQQTRMRHVRGFYNALSGLRNQRKDH